MKTGARGIGLVMAAIALTWPALASANDEIRLAAAGAANLAMPDTAARDPPLVPASPTVKPQTANFVGANASKDVVRLANWVVASGDNHELPFVIVDKIAAKVFVFDSLGKLRGATFALLGKARGDQIIPGIGTRKLSDIRPDERATPAGRFVAALGHDLKNDILWIDYDAAVSMHRVITGNPGDHRLRRLATASSLDKRITYGCINVPVRFYEDIVRKVFAGTGGIVYILPELEPVDVVFPMSEAGASNPQ